MTAVDNDISDKCLVLCLIGGFVGTYYDTIAASIQQIEPLTSFEMARSRLLLEESRQSQEPPHQTASFVAQTRTSAALPYRHLPRR